MLHVFETREKNVTANRKKNLSVFRDCGQKTFDAFSEWKGMF